MIIWMRNNYELQNETFLFLLEIVISIILDSINRAWFANDMSFCSRARNPTYFLNEVT
jgi:hypothetical protein